MDRVAEAEFGVGQQLAPISVEHDVLASREERDGRGEIRDRPQIVLRVQRPNSGIEAISSSCVTSIQPRRRPSSGSA